MSRVRVLGVRRLDPRGQACVAGFRPEFRIPALAAVVERTSAVGVSLTFLDGGGHVVLGCDRTAAPVGNRGWCARSVGRLFSGRLRDARVDILCRDAEGEPLGLAWIEPAAGVRWVVVVNGAKTEIEEVTARLPVRVATTDVDVAGSSATFDVTEFPARTERRCAGTDCSARCGRLSPAASVATRPCEGSGGVTALYRKYRPQDFDEVVGQEAVVRTLRNAIERDQVRQAYLFAGPRGTGKTSMARILAKALNCAAGPTTSPDGTCQSCVSISAGTSLDVIEMDAASQRGIDDIREIRERVVLQPAEGRHKVYILDEAHRSRMPPGMRC